MERMLDRSPIALPALTNAPPEIRRGRLWFARRAEALLQAAGLVDFAGEPGLVLPQDREAARAEGKALVQALPAIGTAGRAKTRYLRTLTAQGLCVCTNLSAMECTALEDTCGLAHEALSALALEALSRGQDVILCRSPLEADRLEAVLLPKAGRAYLSDRIGIVCQRTIALDQILDPERRTALRDEQQRDTQLQAALITQAAALAQNIAILASIVN